MFDAMHLRLFASIGGTVIGCAMLATIVGTGASGVDASPVSQSSTVAVPMACDLGGTSGATCTPHDDHH